MPARTKKVGGRRYRTVNVGYVSVAVGARPWASLFALAVMYNACDFAWAYAPVAAPEPYYYNPWEQQVRLYDIRASPMEQLALQEDFLYQVTGYIAPYCCTTHIFGEEREP